MTASAHPHRARFADDPGHCRRWNGHHQQIDGLRQVCHSRHCQAAVDHRGVRVDRIDAAGEAVVENVGQQFPSHAAWFRPAPTTATLRGASIGRSECSSALRSRASIAARAALSKSVAMRTLDTLP